MTTVWDYESARARGSAQRGFLLIRGLSFSWRVAAILTVVATLTAVSPAIGQDAYAATASLAVADATDEASMAAAEIEPPPLPEGGEEIPAEPSIEPNASAGDSAPIPRKYHYSLRLTIRGVYDDNIDLSPFTFNKVSGYYFAIEPGITIGIGDVGAQQGNYVQLDYAPSFFLFVDRPDENGVQNVFRVSGLHHFGHLTLSLSQDIELLDDANLNTTANTGPGGSTAFLDVRGQAQVNIYNTLVNAAYDLTGKLFLSGGMQYNVSAYQDELISSEVLSGNLFMNYNYSPKLIVGIGGTVGYNWVESSNPGQTYEQINARVTYQATGKISINASGGVEFRQFDEPGSSGRTSPVYTIEATYQPFDGTSISLTGSRGTTNSAASINQDYVNTNVFFGIRQRLLQRFNIAVAGGYQNSEYFSTVTGLNTMRSDNYFFIQPSVDVKVTRFWTVGVYYLHRRDDSSISFSGFDNNQVGMRTALAF